MDDTSGPSGGDRASQTDFTRGRAAGPWRRRRSTVRCCVCTLECVSPCPLSLVTRPPAAACAGSDPPQTSLRADTQRQRRDDRTTRHDTRLAACWPHLCACVGVRTENAGHRSSASNSGAIRDDARVAAPELAVPAVLGCGVPPSRARRSVSHGHVQRWLRDLHRRRIFAHHCCQRRRVDDGRLECQCVGATNRRGGHGDLPIDLVHRRQRQ